MKTWRQTVRGLKPLLLTAAVLSAFSSAQAEFSEIPTLGGTESYVYGISADGAVAVGITYLPGDSYPVAYRWVNGAIEGLGTPVGSSSTVTAVSADGRVIIGHARDESYRQYAFRWANGNFEDLGTFGGSYSVAYAVSADGGVVVGAANTGSDAQYAFRWVGGTMYNLGAPDGHLGSYAADVSADGKVVVGDSHPTGSTTRAFRWVAGDDDVSGVFTVLGTPGGSSSRAKAVSADGAVVIGHSGPDYSRAYRWIDDEMTDLGTLGGNGSYAADLSSDGSVVVGSSYNFGGRDRAFRWMAGENGDPGVMSDLGTLGGDYSQANAVSADGSVVVGQAHASTNRSTAFRWHEATGMLSIADWLAENGVSVEGWDLDNAMGISGDGSVIIGSGNNPDGFTRGWLASANALIEPAQWLNTVSGSRQVFHTGLQLGNLALHGAHHRPLMTYEQIGAGPGYWLTGDLGSYGDGRDTVAGSAEFGLYNDYANGRLRAGLGLGYSGQRQDLPRSGSADLDGGYLVAEINWQATSDPHLILSATAFYGLWDADVKRGYLNGSAVDHSRGDTDVQNTALRLKADWLDAARLGEMRIDPYLGLTLSHTRVDGYSEKGGGVPAQFDTQRHDAQELRLGAAGLQPITEALRLRLTLEGVHRFDDRGPSLSGQDLAGFGISFDLPGDKIDRTWVRGGGELECRIDEASMVSVSVQGASSGQDPDISGAITYRRSL